MWAQGGVDPPVPGSGWDLNVLQSEHTYIAKNTLLQSEVHTQWDLRLMYCKVKYTVGSRTAKNTTHTLSVVRSFSNVILQYCSNVKVLWL